MRRGANEQRAERIDIVEVLRGLASIAVAWLHLTDNYAIGSMARIAGSLGGLGVDCFFVISGFVIPYSLHRAGYELKNFGRFWGRRMVRLEPPYLASIIVVIVLQKLSEAAPGFHGGILIFTAFQIFYHLFYIIPLTRYSWVNLVYWTLAYEFVFYILCGLAFDALWRRNSIFTCAAAMAIFCAKVAIWHSYDPRIFLFLMGIATARFFVGKDKAFPFLAIVLLSAIAMVNFGGSNSALVGGGTALIIAWVRIKPWRWLTGLGSVSYSLYLLHVPVGGRVVRIGKRFIHSSWQEFALSALAVIVSLAAAYVFYRLIEVPATIAARRIRYRQDAEGLSSSP